MKSGLLTGFFHIIYISLFFSLKNGYYKNNVIKGG
jgi:hypothetical protein